MIFVLKQCYYGQKTDPFNNFCPAWSNMPPPPYPIVDEYEKSKEKGLKLTKKVTKLKKKGTKLKKKMLQHSRKKLQNSRKMNKTQEKIYACIYQQYLEMLFP